MEDFKNMVTAFEITINNETKIVAGVEGISVLSFILSYRENAREHQNISSIELRVGGLLHHGKHDYEHLNWIKRHLNLGDEIVIRVVETSDLTQPIFRQREDPKLVENARRKYYENLKKEYADELDSKFN